MVIKKWGKKGIADDEFPEKKKKKENNFIWVFFHDKGF